MNYKYITGQVLEIDPSSGWTDGTLLQDIYPDSSFVSGNNTDSMQMKPEIKIKPSDMIKYGFEKDEWFSNFSFSLSSPLHTISFVDVLLWCIGDDLIEDLFDLGSLLMVSGFVILVGLDDGVDSIKTSVVVNGKLS